MSVQVRRFRRSDRDQLTALVNAHVQAVVPGYTIPTNRVLAQLEGEPQEFIVDPWVAERCTLVAEQRGRIAAAAHLLRFADDARVGDRYRGAGEIRWLLQWPPAPFWPDADDAGRAVLRGAIQVLRHAGHIRCDPSLPAPGVYGVPREWRHIEQRLVEVGFRPGDRRETVWLTDLNGRRSTPAPLPGIQLVRFVGINGTRLAAEVAGETVGYIEVDIRGNEGSLIPSGSGWADIGNLEVDPRYRRRGIARCLFDQAVDLLSLGHVDRLLAYSNDDEHIETAVATSLGFRPLTRVTLGWELESGS